MTQAQVASDSKKVHDLQVVLEITRSLQVEKDLDRLLELIIAAATDVVDAERSTLFLVSSDGKELYSKIAEGTENSEIRFGMGVGIAGTVAQQREVVRIDDAYADDRFNPEVDKRTGFRTRSIVCMPLLTHEEKVVGVIQCLNKKEGQFSDYDVEILSALATQAAVTIDNALLIGHYLEKQRLQAALSVAREIQVSLLPRRSPEIPGWSISAVSMACDETGGDYYDFFRLDDNHLGFVIGDVSGHGVGSSLLMATARAALRTLRPSMFDIEGTVRHLNSLLVEDMEKGRFMTLLFGILDLESGVMRYTSAGHDAPLHFRAKENEFVHLDSTGLPLGWIDEGYMLEVGQDTLEPGDILVLMTDGIWEAMNNQREAYGKERICEVVRRMKDDPSEAVVQQLFKEMGEFCKGMSRQDDVTVIALQRVTDSRPLSQ
ncbi:MAG: GAF domain-containing SpoIIE family protein phosphatase [Myxococcota bacterium]